MFLTLDQMFVIYPTVGKPILAIYQRLVLIYAVCMNKVTKLDISTEPRHEKTRFCLCENKDCRSAVQ